MLLGIDTTTRICSVALVDEQRLLAEFTLLLSRTHSQQLLPLIEQMFIQSGKDKRELTAVAVARGPGSFTGVRIGLATAAGIGIGLSVPVVGVVTLDALAGAALFSNGLVVPLMDARRKQVYTALYESRDGKMQRVTPYMAAAVDELAKTIASRKDTGPIFCLGDGLIPYDRQLHNLLGHRFCPLPPALAANRAALVAQEGRLLLEQGDITTDPLYIRLSDAERRRLSMQEGEGFCG